MASEVKVDPDRGALWGIPYYSSKRKPMEKREKRGCNRGSLGTLTLPPLFLSRKSYFLSSRWFKIPENHEF